MKKVDELEFDFPEMEITEEEMKDKNKDAYDEVIKEKKKNEASMVDELKAAVESGKESGEFLSEKTNIDDSRISEVYKGMGMAAGVTIGVGKVTKKMSERLTGKLMDKITEVVEEKKK